jgi:putative ABC transport system permease protein
MLKNYLKTAWRNLISKKSYSLMMLVGLTAGLAFSFVIASYVWSELQVNQSLRNLDRQFLLKSTWKQDGRAPDFVTPAPLGKTLKEQYPHLIANEYTYDAVSVTMQKGEIVHSESVQLGDNILTIYGLKLSQGDVNTALEDPFSMVVSEEFALKYFGRKEVLDEIVDVESFSGERQPFRISGVLEKVPYASVIQLVNDNVPVLMSKQSLAYFGRLDGLDLWQNLFVVNNIELQKGVQKTQVESAIVNLLKEKAPADVSDNLTVSLADYQTLYLEGKDGFVKKNLQTLSAIALVMLLIGIINFVNLTLGSSASRLKEIGIRKSLGSNKRQLVFQLLFESTLLSFFAFLFALLFYQFGRNYFSDILGKPLQSLFDINPIFFVYTFFFALFVGMISTLFPALTLSRLSVVMAVKNRFNSVSGQMNLRRVLIGVQFALALFVGFAGVVVSKQVNYFFDQDLGFNKDQMVYMTLPRDWSAQGVSKMKVLRAEFEKLPQVEKGTVSFEIPDGRSGMRSGVKKLGSDDAPLVYAEILQSDESYLEAFELKLLAGRFHNQGSEATNQIILNETAIKSLGYEDASEALNQTLNLDTYNSDFEIVGVISDFHFGSFHKNIGPIVFTNINNANIYRYLSLRLNGSDFGEAKSAIETKWKELLPNSPFIYVTQESNLAKLYGAELRLKKASKLATILASTLVALGVLGTLSLSIAKRIKELSLRRVLGANSLSVNWLFIKEFIAIIGISIAFALPITYYILSDWLQNYAYAISFPFLSFVLFGVLFVSGILLISIYQISKALRLNPVVHLKE